MPLGAFKLNGIANQFFQRPISVFSLGGNAQISTAQSKFGNSSLLLDGSGDYCLSTTNPPVWRWYERNQFTVECWIYMIALSGSQFYNDPQLIGNIRTDGFDNQWAMGPDNDGDLTFKYYNGADQRIVSTGSKIAINTWYHVAAVINGTSVKIYQNGTEVGSGTWSGSPFNNDNHGINIGGGYQTTGFNGYVDEVRISNTARYTANFTPSTTPFSNDANTLLLLHFDEPNASTTITDDASEVFDAVQSVSLPTSATSTASTITVPAAAAANDIAILFDTSTTTTDTTPSGWTSISKTTTTGIRTNISYKKLVSGDVNSSITGMAGTTRKVMVIVRADINPTNIKLSNASAQSTTSAPSNQTITLANNLQPIVGFACYASTGNVGTRGWSTGNPSEYSSVSTSSVYVKALAYNPGAVNATPTISMSDNGTNTLQSFYLHLS
jgi:hypothetical protein